MSTAKAKK